MKQGGYHVRVAEFKFRARSGRVLRVLYRAGTGWMFRPWAGRMDELEMEISVNNFFLAVYNRLQAPDIEWPGTWFPDHANRDYWVVRDANIPGLTLTRESLREDPATYPDNATF